MVQKRHQYEQQVSKERTTLESKIKEEQEKIATQTKLAEQISSQRIELENVGVERAQIVKKMEKEKSIIEKDLKTRKEQLSQAQLEEKELAKQIEQEINAIREQHSKEAEKQRQRQVDNLERFSFDDG